MTTSTSYSNFNEQPRSEIGWMVKGAELNALTKNEAYIQKTYDHISDEPNQKKQDEILANLFHSPIMARSIVRDMYEHQETRETALPNIWVEEDAIDKLNKYDKDVKPSKTTKKFVQDKPFDTEQTVELRMAIENYLETIRTMHSHYLQVFVFTLCKTDGIRFLSDENRSLLMPLIQRVHNNCEKYTQTELFNTFLIKRADYINISKKQKEMFKNCF